jgi:L-fuculose-phosphate aldolase
VKAVVHAHPQYATTLAVANIALDKIIFPTGFSFLGHVPIVPYATSTTVELGDSIRKFIEDGQNALILGNHGALTCGETLWDAYYLMERLENYAQITYMSKLIGGGRELTDDEKIRLQAKIDRQKKAGLL